MTYLYCNNYDWFFPTFIKIFLLTFHVSLLVTLGCHHGRLALHM